MLFYFVYLVCLKGTFCTEQNALISRAMITESCLEETTKLTNWAEQALKNPLSDPITFDIKCHVIQDKRG